jgi:hypothetical protein
MTRFFFMRFKKQKLSFFWFRMKQKWRLKI